MGPKSRPLVIYLKLPGVSVQVSGQPLVAEAASLIEKETNQHRTSNVQHPTSNECILSVLKKIS
jgi:hypothetical protein